MTLADHIARSCKGAQFPVHRAIYMVKLLKLTGAAAQSTADATMLRLCIEQRKGGRA